MSDLAHRLLTALKPAAFRIDNKERLRALIGAGLGILITAQLSHWLTDNVLHTYWLVGSLGASALLVFLLPSSPLAQPYAVVLGNTSGAIVGITCTLLHLPPIPSAAAAVSLSMAVMFLLRCVHPPGVAVALFATLTQIGDFSFALLPIFVDSLILVLIGMTYNTLTGKPYPHLAPPLAPAAPARPSRFSDADLDRALAHYNRALDISRGDLEQLLQFAETSAYERNIGALRCSAVMSRQPLSVTPDMPVPQAWGMLREHKLKALPVVTADKQLIGIVTATDFAAPLEEAKVAPTARRGLRALLRRKPLPVTRQPATIASIMTTDVAHAREDEPVIDLIPRFAQGRYRHIPVLDGQRRLVGIVTQSDLLQALYRTVRPETA